MDQKEHEEKKAWVQAERVLAGKEIDLMGAITVDGVGCASKNMCP